MDGGFHWRFTALRLRLLGMDARAFICVPIFLVHMSKLTALIVLGTLVFFWLLERRGYSLTVFFKVLRLRIGGLFRWPVVISQGRRYGWRFDY